MVRICGYSRFYHLLDEYVSPIMDNKRPIQNAGFMDFGYCNVLLHSSCSKSKNNDRNEHT